MVGNGKGKAKMVVNSGKWAEMEGTVGNRLEWFEMGGNGE